MNHMTKLILSMKKILTKMIFFVEISNINMLTVPINKSAKSIIASYTPCHEILPNLFVGSQLALDYTFLKLLNINVVISCRPLNRYQKNILKSLNIIHHDLTVRHSDFCNQYASLQEKSNEVFSECLQHEKRVLIHCNSGFHRSVTLTAGYLMKSKEWDYEQAFNYIKEIRPCIDMKYTILENNICICNDKN
jgi:hypothetical protein